MNRLHLALACLLLPSTATARDGVDLAGKSFVLVASRGHPFPPGTVRLGFGENGSVGFDAGCNHHSGSYQLSEDELVVPNLGSTRRRCSDEVGARERWLSGFVRGRPRVRVDGARLTLESSDARLEFSLREVAAPDLALAGPTWSIHLLVETARSAILLGAPRPSVVFATNGSVRIDTRCNRGTGRYVKVSPTEIGLQRVTFTSKPCKGARGDTDRHLRTLFASPTLTFGIEETKLSLTGAERVGVEATARR